VCGQPTLFCIVPSPFECPRGTDFDPTTGVGTLLAEVHGGPGATKGIFVETLIQDIRYGLRSLARNPGFTAVALMSLVLGIGASSVIFSVADGVLLRPLQFPDSDRIVTLWNTYPHLGAKREEVSPPDFYDWHELSESFGQMAAYERYSYVLAGSDNGIRLRAARVSGDFFATMGVVPAVGRVLNPADDHVGSHHVVVLTNHLWAMQFGSDSSIIGREVVLNGFSFSVVGVMPAGFDFPGDVDIWVPLAYQPPFDDSLRQSTWLRTVARLKPDVTVDQAQAEMSTIAHQLEHKYPDTNLGRDVLIISLFEQIVGRIRPALLILLAAVGCLHLIACTNVANLLLSQATVRQKEISIRSVLGAGRLRLVRQLVTESTALSILSGVGGIVLTVWALQVVRTLNPDGIPRLQEIQLDVRVLTFAFVASLVTGIAVGIAPALMVTRRGIRDDTREFGVSTEDKRRRRVRAALVIAEIALAQILLVAGGLLFQSFLRLNSVDPGFRPDDMTASRLDLNTKRYNDVDERRRLYSNVVERISRLPTVKSVALASTIPTHEVQLTLDYVITGQPRPTRTKYPNAGYNSITPDYFRTMGMRLLEGRSFNESDREGSAPVVIINHAMARRHWPGKSPLGERIKIIPDDSSNDAPEIEIVGVVDDVRQVGLDTEVRSEMYLPYAQKPWRTCFLLVRSTSQPSDLAPTLREQIREIDPDIALTRPRSMNDYISASLVSPRFRTFLFSVFASLALVLAAIGVFGVVSYSVVQRTAEFGIRVALGAQQRDILRTVVGKAYPAVLAGVVLGLACSLALTRYLSALLFDIAPDDAFTFAASAVLCGSVGFAACYLPSRRAAQTDPLKALRYD
jgi:putative ABC transport system permease protein